MPTNRTSFGTLLVLAAALLAVGCTSLPTNYPRTVSTALKTPPSSGVAGAFEREAGRHPGKSGFEVIPNNREAFTDRVALARFAQKTLDVQYYIWATDTTGMMLGDELIRAAERGVRVRFLLDDVNFKKRDNAAAAIAAHPNIEVRIFNPAQHRSLRSLEFAANFRRLNKRMHNKIMVMDNACVILGGRNIADEYFGLGKTLNFRDLDLVAVGPVVRDVSAVFDEFWNSIAAVPIEQLVGAERSIEDFQKQVASHREQIRSNPAPFPLEADRRALRERISGIKDDLVWANGRFLYDSIDSMKTGSSDTTTVKHSLTTEMANARKEILIESAYLVVRNPGLDWIRSTTGRGVKVRALTNSLASNDVVAAQSGHAKNRGALLDAGLDLYEMQPAAAAALEEVAPQSRHATTALHTKAMVIDGEHAFVGSFNFDPRSADINSEIGLLVDSPEFARQVKAFLDEGIQPANAYHVVRDQRGKVRWETTIDGQARSWTTDPESSALRRFTEDVLSILPIQNQL